MSKTLSSRLTPSRKKRRRMAGQPALDWDAADGRCHRLDMLAELLAACGQPLEAEVIERAGCWLSEEVAALKTLLTAARKEAAR